ncbi:CYP749A22 protein [Hibiscus syriacus]|uniref:CYP749A22 protein n=1 Tax=Hibiscus syriacus TaxID=106335 RepID=A0A6A3AJS6_HIBSY|nr:CYP749A22 protein [Hibiscus syriacus]
MANSIREVGKNTLGLSTGKVKEHKESWWWNDEVQTKVKTKQTCFKELLQCNNDEERSRVKQRYKEAKREAKKTVAKAKDKAYEEMYKRLHTKVGQNGIFRLAKSRENRKNDLGSIRFIKDNNCVLLVKDYDIKRVWGSYFFVLFNNGASPCRDNSVDGSSDHHTTANYCLTSRIEIEEVKMALRKMGRDKVVGPDQIPVTVRLTLGEEGVKSTTEAIHLLRRLMEKYREKNRDLHIAFIDLEKVSITYVRTTVGDTEAFPIEIGLHQGSALSPYIFALIMDDIYYTTPYGVPWYMLFADDIVLVAETKNELNSRLATWKTVLEEKGLRINIENTYWLSSNYSGNQNDANVEVGWLKWRDVTGVLCDKKVPLKLKGKFYKMAIKSALLYESECWAIKKDHVRRMEVADMRMFRWACGRTLWDMTPNSAIRMSLGVVPVSEKLREGRLRWFGHVLSELEILPMSVGRGRWPGRGRILSVLMELVILVPCSFFLIASIKLLYDYLWIPLRIQNLLNSQEIKGPRYRFIHGNNKEVTKMKNEALSKSMDLAHDIFPKVQPHLYSWINRYGKNYLYWKGVRPQLVISEPELVKEVLINNENAYPKLKLPIYVSKLLGNGIVTTEGEKWVRQRKLANYVFHGESLKNMTPAVLASVETMLENWKGEEGKEIDVFQEFRLLTSEVISRTAFGSTYLEGEKIFAMLNKLIIWDRNAFKTNIPIINKLWKSADLLESEKLAKEIQDCVMKIVKKREDEVVNGLSLEDLVGECKTFYFSGQETVNSLLSWTVFLLAIHGDWQEKARREVIQILGNQNPHPEGIAKLKTITMIINETPRLYGPTTLLAREVAREVQLGKLVLPANVNLLFPIMALHHDPHLWGDDVHMFKPERFAEGIGRATKYNAASFFPFGLGPRSCVGMTFSLTETKFALSMILQCYTFTLSPAYVHSPMSIITLRPQHGIQIILESLNKDA